MAHEFSQLHRVEFADTDAAGQAHFTAFFRWMEETEHAFYRSFGGTAYERDREGERGMPRVSAACDFFRPVGYGDQVEVLLRLVEKGSRKLVYAFDFLAHPGGEEIARGRMTVVSAFRPADGGAFRSMALPETLGRHIEAPE